MSERSLLQQVGCELVAECFRERQLGSLSVTWIGSILGRADAVGSQRPLESSAARLCLGDQDIWIPAPCEAAEPENGRAPLYRHGGQLFVLPTVRLLIGEEVAFLTLSDWLLDALTKWRFVAGREGGRPLSLLERLAKVNPGDAECLRAVAVLIRYALFGADGPSRAAGLVLPNAPMWLRPAGETPFAREVSRALVITARLRSDDTETDEDIEPTAETAPDPSDQRQSKPVMPTTYIRAADNRIRPADPRDWGLDPVHTPEGEDIRLTGRLGVGVAVSERKLVWPATNEPPLSPSTARLPFAGYDDPRRLLMAANMQAHAVPLPQQEPPRVRQGAGEDPPGVNLRVAYLAWQGWNHEDAWVLSASASRKLGTFEDVVQTIGIRAVEMVPKVVVAVGVAVKRGDLLVRRFVAPALLCSAIEVLAALPELGETIPLQPEFDDRAPVDGTVVRLELWDLRNRKTETWEGEQSHTEDATWEVPETTVGTYRAVYRVHIRRELPLAVGDKLANRHGHKGVVGAIVPDDEMPRWRGEPLEALIDPISVLNRSNWGQVYEALAGALVAPGQSRDFRAESGTQVLEEVQALGADKLGRWAIQPGDKADWLTKELRAVAGVQYVMRMPHHACDKLSGSPLPKGVLRGRMRRRAQRLGEMEQWALWAHRLNLTPNSAETPATRTLSAATERLRRLLHCAGYALDKSEEALTLRRLALNQEPPLGWTSFSLAKVQEVVSKHGKATAASKGLRSLADLSVALDAVVPEMPTVFVFDPPLRTPPKKDGQPPRFEIVLCWLPILPASDRPPRRMYDGSEEPHELTRDLRRVLRLLRERPRPAPNEAVKPEDDAELYYAVRRLMRDAQALAVGLSATGQFSSKRSFLRRVVLGRQLERSARATVSPGGTLFLSLDEIGIPVPVAHTLFGPDLPADLDALTKHLADRWVWLKRDPVLHRWGIVPVRVRPVEGDTIRLPASLLGPLGADYDGDTVALFAAQPPLPTDPQACRPSALAWHPVVKEPMYKPGKQYQYGLRLLAQDAERLRKFQEALIAAGAPECNPEDLNSWVKQASEHSPQGVWWAILEKHALDALADKPDLDFGLLNLDELTVLNAVKWKAAKNLYDGDVARNAMTQILAGRSLDIYRYGAATVDPIADVMVAGKTAIGYFGGALRRIVYSANERQLTPDTIQNAQALTEQVTQKALSVKAGKPPLQFNQFNRQLRRLLSHEDATPSKDLELEELLNNPQIKVVWAALKQTMPAADAQPVWLRWLRSPYELEKLLKITAAGVIRLPLADLRLSGWE